MCGRLASLIIVLLCSAALQRGQTTRPSAALQRIDPQASTLTVYVYRSGVFKFAADNHEIRAPIASGSVDEGARTVELTIDARNLQVLDPGLNADKRAEVQQRMLSPEVLDPDRYPAITFRSRSVEAGADHLLVRGNLTLHGQTRPVTVQVSRMASGYRGTATLNQTDFGIKPIRVAGGAVKVKDQVKIEFDIRTR